ncbi:unnamed protein product [Vitrella brassicaformis CCMP3155]|uniref:Phospholipase C/D domain-containing protein n=2 Tax=Vitrella brassicaformis TaxID=1169539 RepID=A0A0G4EFN8_VITBC|nr:unnamed protein product [Vitrella brassicaformis CCMP3155]|eukprot:CEL94193.1 unnamed protein product [Vitrella brassicaformis CCMP3155]
MRYAHMMDMGFASLLREHRDAAWAGGVFPDFFYGCGNRDAAEDAHWRPFHLTIVSHILSLPPSHRPPLVAFLLGMVSHYMADTNWHGLQQAGGFGWLQYSGMADFGCDGGLCQAAHTSGDVGGEFVLGVEDSLRKNGVSKDWWLPTATLHKVLAKRGFAISPTAIRRCAVLIRAEREAAKDAAPLLYSRFAKTNPFIRENLQQFWAGGIDDMTVFTLIAWQRTWQWLKHGPPAKLPQCIIPPNNISDRQKQESKGRLHGLTATERGNEDLLMWKEGSYGYEGHAIKACDVNSDGVDEWVVSAPGYSTSPDCPSCGRVTLYFDPYDMQTKIEILGVEPLGRFGWSVECLDLDRDGEKDIIVSAPQSTGSLDAIDLTCERKNATGAVFVFHRIPQPTGGRITLTATDLPHYRIDGNTAESNYGMHLATADMDQDGQDDLMVSSPLAASVRVLEDGNSTLSTLSQGTVDVFLSRAHNSQPNPPPHLTLTSPSLADGFGQCVCASTVDGQTILIVGAPLYGDDKGAGGTRLVGGGAIYGYRVKSTNADGGGLAAAEVFNVVNAEPHARFGISCAVVPSSDASEAMVWVGAPGATNHGSFPLRPLDSAGYIYGFKSSDLIAHGRSRKATSLADMPSETVASPHPTELARFGAQMMVKPRRGNETATVVISAPFYGKESGGWTLFEANGESLNLQLTVLGRRGNKGRHGSSIEMGCLRETQGCRETVLVGSPHLSSNAREDRKEGRWILYDSLTAQTRYDSRNAHRRHRVGETDRPATHHDRGDVKRGFSLSFVVRVVHEVCQHFYWMLPGDSFMSMNG